MLKNQLATASAITIGMLFALIYFGDSNLALNKAQIITLGLGVIAWLALLYSQKSLKQSKPSALMQVSEAAPVNLSSNLSELLGNIQVELNEHIAATQAELLQVKSLMDDAIDDLVDRFISLEVSTRICQNLVTHITLNEVSTKANHDSLNNKPVKLIDLLHETSTLINKLIIDSKSNQAVCVNLINSDKITDDTSRNNLSKVLSNSKDFHKETKLIARKITAIIKEKNDDLATIISEINIISTQIEADVKAAIKSLQFQDLSTQLIVQCGERQNIMHLTLNAVNAINDKKNTQTSLAQIQEKLIEANDELKKVNKVRMKQFNVDAGHVEMFG